MNEPHRAFRPVAILFLLTLLVQGCMVQMNSTRSLDEFIQQDNTFISRHISSSNSRAGAPHLFEYGLKREGEDYQGWLKIRTEQGVQLWADEWVMRAGDLNELVATEGGMQKDRKSECKPYVAGTEQNGLALKDWVGNIFSGKLRYGVEIGEEKLKAGDLNSEYLTFYGKKFNTMPARLKDEILVQSRNLRVAYRATWREDYKELVFVPSLNQYIMYGNGQY